MFVITQGFRYTGARYIRVLLHTFFTVTFTELKNIARRIFRYKGVRYIGVTLYLAIYGFKSWRFNLLTSTYPAKELCFRFPSFQHMYQIPLVLILDGNS